MANSQMSEPIRILVVEDHHVTRDGLVAGLSREPGFTVIDECSNSDVGLKLAWEQRPNVVLLDLHLPGTMAVSDMIQAFLGIPDIKVIIFSAEMRLAFVQSVLEMGVAAYLLKSESMDKVANTVRKVAYGSKGISSEQLIGDHKKITPAEQEVLHMLGKGMKYHEIAEERCTSVPTARKQVEILQIKLNLDSREQLIAWAVENGYGNKDFDR
jgi:DNA-binding NarL/FixJ family response regulator